MRYQTSSGGAFTSIDLVAERVELLHLRVGYSHPSELTFLTRQPQHTIPYPIGSFVQLWDDAELDPDGNAFSSSNPLFEGFLEAPEPTESNTVNYTAYDATKRASLEARIMSTGWDAGPPIVRGLGAIPRLVFNVKIDNDDDYAFERAHNLTVGQMVELVLNDALFPLRYFNAAPAAGNPFGAETASWTFKPQEKIVFESEGIRSGLERLMQIYSAWKLLWIPGTRKWRWFDITTAPQTTLTLNDFSGTHKVLDMDLRRSIEGRYTAILYTGPNTNDTALFSTLDGSLVETGNGIFIETYVDAGGSHDVIAETVWQIGDPDKRRGARMLPAQVPLQVDDLHWVMTRSPTLQVTFDGGDTWLGVQGAVFDFQNGTASIGSTVMYVYVDPPPGLPASNQRYFLPDGVRLLWAPYVDPITVRVPVSGWEGTAYTVAGWTAQMEVYSEDLAVGFERGVPVTTPIRVAQFEQLGRAQLEGRKNLLYPGTCILDGGAWEFCRLNRRINLAAIDADGQPLVTGWEAIHAALTDYEYDFQNDLAQVTFSSDLFELIGEDVGRMKQALRIKELMRVSETKLYGQINFNANSFIYTVEHYAYIDPETGALG